MSADENDTMNNLEFQKHTWEVVNALFGNDRQSIGKQLVGHQLESYNDFVSTKLEHIIGGFNNVEILHKYNNEISDFKYKVCLTIDNPRLCKPIIYEKDGSTKLMTPKEARQRNFSYSCTLSVDITIKTEWYDEENRSKESEKVVRNVNIGKIPIMVGSKYCVLSNINDPFHSSTITSECKYDSGGYFIINGNEKVIISHDRISENKTYVFLDTKGSQYSHIAEIRSVPDNTFGPPKLTTLKMTSRGNQFGRLMRITIHHVRTDIPVFILFKALGIESDKQIIELCVYDIDQKDSKIFMDNLKGCVNEASCIKTRYQALDYLSKYLNISGYPKEIITNKNKRINIVLDILKNDLLPHVGENYEDKALYLGYMLRKLLQCVLGMRNFDDRDSYLNKRIDSPGVMISNLFRQYYGKMIKDAKNMIYKELNSGMWKSSSNIENIINKNNIYKIIKPTTIESGLKYGLATGNWGIKNINSKQGVAQVLNRLTYYATLSHLRRVNTPIEKSGKLVQPRKLHNTQWGIICPAETPEGGSVGLVKNLAISAKITIASNSTVVLEFLKDNGMCEFSLNTVEELHKNTCITLNGKILGTHQNAKELYDKLVHAKRQGHINIYTSIVWDVEFKTIRVSTEGGRAVRPVFFLEENNHLPFDLEYIRNLDSQTKWIDMCSNIGGKNLNIVEYIDVEESNCRLIAMTIDDLKKPIRFTHMEIHPSLILGVLASNIPFSDHNQAPRNCYQCLWEEEPVLMADGQNKKIKDIRIGDEVMSFDPHTMKTSSTKVVNQYVKPTDKNIVEVETISGRKIVTTDDHKYWTNQGWISPREFNNDTKVGVLCGESGSHLTNDIHLYNRELSRSQCNEMNINMKELQEATYIQDSTMFMPVKVRQKPNCMIADITVESDNHCFFGGDCFAVHNSAMGKQAIGLYTSNYRHRLDTISHVLNYPQKPLVNTNMARKLFADEVPCGINVIVAIATFSGYNQEDSIMLNRSSVQRGLFGSTYYRTIKEQCNKNLSTGEEEVFCNPNELIKGLDKQLYTTLQSDGTVKENTFVKPGDVIIGKCMPIKSNESISYKDTSVILKDNEYGFVDMNCSSNKYFTNISAEGYTFNKMRIRNYREPTIGDKLSSKHGQKGTIGMIYDQFDMPFTKDGLVPDIIINPHAIPSRMTIAQLIETIMGKACLVKGSYGNATPFTNISVDTITRVLENDCGLDAWGNEIMYNSRTGEQQKTQIFVGPTYYQRLKHMVTDKIHSRSSNGPIVLLTRQPAEGRARAGGLRLGEMEVECNWGHGTMQFLKERFMECSDNYRLFICKKCNNVATNVNPEKNIYNCNMCDNRTHFEEVRLPYASKLMFQEIQSMGISTKFITE
tara:strand:+ start:2097 stop:6176 length:4080 start_codon:yes stop_codon:yes gene_type:complete